MDDKLLNKDWEKVKIKHFENGIFKSFISKELENIRTELIKSQIKFLKRIVKKRLLIKMIFFSKNY
tara:strand:+ start:336 stop:533 length:198 start_codon:yes stop_codon:yes gene_type:complete